MIIGLHYPLGTVSKVNKIDHLYDTEILKIVLGGSIFVCHKKRVFEKYCFFPIHLFDNFCWLFFFDECFRWTILRVMFMRIRWMFSSLYLHVFSIANLSWDDERDWHIMSMKGRSAWAERGMPLRRIVSANGLVSDVNKGKAVNSNGQGTVDSY